MVDLAHELDDEDQVEWALRQLQFRRLFHREGLELANNRRPSRTITRLLDSLPQTGSPLEVAFLNKVVRQHGLPHPDCQAKREGFRVDFYWADQRLVVEVDGKYHDLPYQRAADAVRDAILTAQGDRVLRYRYSDVHRDHHRTAQAIRHSLCE